MSEIEVDVWELAEVAIKALPPILRDDDLTPQRLYEKHKDVLTGEGEARALLEEMAKNGILLKVECRSGKGGSHVFAYRAVKKGKG